MFLSESIALSKSETLRLVKKFDEHKIVENIKPDIIIIDKKKYDIKIKPSPEYNQIYDTKYFRVLKLM